MNKLTIISCVLLCCFSFRGYTDALKILDRLSSEDHLIENLKELFTINDKKKLNLENLAFMDHELLYKLMEDNKIEDLSAIESISIYKMKTVLNKNSKYSDCGFQIWKFDNKDNAKLYFNVMKEATNTSSYYEKPPKRFFLVSDELYYFSFVYNRLKYIVQAENKLIDCCFSKDEMFFSYK